MISGWITASESTGAPERFDLSRSLLYY